MSLAIKLMLSLKTFIKNITQKLFQVNSRIKQNILINSKNADSWMNDLSEAQEEGNIFIKSWKKLIQKKR